MQSNNYKQKYYKYKIKYLNLINNNKIIGGGQIKIKMYMQL